MTSGLLTLTLVGALVVLPAPASVAATITVTEAFDDDPLVNNGRCSLREAIIAANTDTSVDSCSAGSGADTIIVPSGTYKLDSARGALEITSTLRIQGAGASSTQVVGNTPGSTAFPDRIFRVQAGAVARMFDLTVRGGRSPTGGGILNEGTLVLRRAIVTGSRALEDGTFEGRGGGIYNTGTLRVRASTVHQNIADPRGGSGGEGGGIYNTGTLVVRSSAISQNAAEGGTSFGGQGAGIHSGSGSVRLISSTVSGNVARSAPLGARAGGVHAFGTVVIRSSVISHNVAEGGASGAGSGGSGGGLEVLAAIGHPDAIIESSVISHNVAGGGSSGGGLAGGVHAFDRVVIRSSEISENVAEAGGTSPGGAGGVFVAQFRTLEIVDSRITGNAARGTNALGGGIYSPSESTVDLIRSRVSGNTSDGAGGGIFNESTSVFQVRRSVISGNAAGTNGGGIFGRGGASSTTVSLVRSTVAGNVAGASGGGVKMASGPGSLVINRSTLSGNRAGVFGGGIDNQGHELQIRNSTISGNVSVQSGAGLWTDADTSVLFSTIARNRSDTLTGGVRVSGGSFELKASIVALNTVGSTGTDCAGEVTSLGANVVRPGGGCPDDGPRDIAANPRLGPLADNGGPTQTHLIRPNSPAIDRLPNANADCGGRDQRNVRRPQGPRCDSGAVERAA